MHIRCPHCHNPVEVVDDDLLAEKSCPACGSSFALVSHTTSATHVAPSGVQRLGHFELIEQIGVGAFGSVWKARDTELDRTVAIKIPRKDQLWPNEVEQFLREARAAAQLRHPSIVSVHEVGREDGTVYIVSDLIEGLTLSDWLSSQQLTNREAAELSAKLADTLQYAHNQGVIHRDVKPGNIMLDAEGEPHVMDFGLAKREAGEITMTVEGRVLGTPAYMSPEQARGEGHHADRRSDIYSLGVILYQLMTGELPFKGTTRMLLYQVLNEEPRSPRYLNDRIPRDLETICLKCLAKEPERRYQSAEDLRDDLQRYLSGRPILARPLGRIARVWRWSKRNRLVAALAAASCLLLVAIQVVLLVAYFRESELRLVSEDRREQAVTAQTQAEQQSKKAAAAARTASLRLVENQLERALSAYEKRDFPTAMLRLAESIETAPQDAGEFLDYARRCVPIWSRDVPYRLQAAFEGEDSVIGAAFSPDGKLLAAAGLHGVLRVWQLDSAEPDRPVVLRPVSDAKQEIWNIAFSPDGRWLAAAVRSMARDVKGSIHVWEVATGELALPLLEHPYTEAWSVAFSPDGSLIMSGDGPSSFLWDARSGELIRGPVWHNGWVSDVEFSSDGQFAFCSDFSGGSFFDVRTGLRVGKFFPAQFEVECVALSPDRTRAIVGGQDGKASIFDAETLEPIGAPIQHHGAVNDVSFSPDSSRVLTASDDFTCRVSDTSTGALITELDHFLRETAEVAQWSADGSRIVTCSGKQIFVWSAGPEPMDVRTLEHEGVVQCLRFTPDGKQLWTASSDTTTWGKLTSVRRWDVETGTQLGPSVALPETAEELVFNRDGSKAAIASVKNRVLLVDTTTGQAQLQPVPIPKAPRNLVLHPDERHFATSIGSDARVWSFTTGKPIGPTVSTERLVGGLDFSHDGKRLIASSYDGKVQVIDVETLQRRGSLLELDLYRLVGSAFLPSDDGFCVIALDTASIWGLDGRQRHETIVHEGRERIWTLAINSDGSLLATAMGNWEETRPGEASVAVWSIPTGHQLGKLIEMPLQAGYLEFSPDSRLLASACMDGHVRIYDIHPDTRTPEQIARWVEAITGRRLDRQGEPRPISTAELQALHKQLEPTSVANAVNHARPEQHELPSPADGNMQLRTPVLHAQQLASRGEYDRAREILIEEIQSARTSDPENLTAIADLMFVRANVENDAGQFDAAADLYEQSLKTFESIDGKQSARAADVVFSLANLELFSRNDEDRGLELYHRWFSTTDRLYGVFGATIDVREQVAEIHERRGEYDDAIRLYREAADINHQCYSKKFGSNRPGLAECLHRLGRVLFAVERMQEAEQAYRDAMAKYVVVYTRQHAKVAEVALDVARVLRKTDRHDEADALVAEFEGVVEIPADLREPTAE